MRPVHSRAAGLIEPCLPSPAKAPPNSPDWLHEIKPDRFRILAHHDATSVRPGGGASAPRAALGILVETMATPAPDLTAQINVPTSPRVTRTNKPGPIDAKRHVPAQPNEHSVDRNAGAFPANPERMAGARARTPASS
jgi:hypothetical protein